MTNEQAAAQALQKLGYDNGFTGIGVALDIKDGFNVKHFEIEYPNQWPEYYQQEGLLYYDPAVLCGTRLTEVYAWSEFKLKDVPKNKDVMAHAKSFGLHDGLVIPVHIYGKKSVICFSVQESRNFDFKIKEELMHKARVIVGMHLNIEDDLLKYDNINPNLLTTLTLIANGKSYEQIAKFQGKDINTIKKRAQSIRKILGAKNNSHAVSLAKDADLIA